MVEDLWDAIISEHAEQVDAGSFGAGKYWMRCALCGRIKCSPHFCHEDLGTFPYVDWKKMRSATVDVQRVFFLEKINVPIRPS